MELKQGDLENIILNALWMTEEDDRDKIDVRDVQNKIRTEHQSWAYTTVKTVLDRLVDKELVLRVKEGKKYLYRSVIDREHAGEEAIKKLVRQYFRNNYSDMISCAERLSLVDTEIKQLATTVNLL
ncbi:MAG: BlaI/MecI/CopY family transcriptional regulator [Vampirovibrionia bacterium]